jgi:hypothetical protein
MKINKIKPSKLKLAVLTVILVIFGYLAGCSNTTTNNQTDEQYLQGVVTGTGSQFTTDEDNMVYEENADLNDGGAVGDIGNPGPNSPIDSLIRWGRIVDHVDINFAGSFSGDTVYSGTVTRTISGHFRIIGLKTGLPDSVDKPYTEVLTRFIAFKRVARTNSPRANWRLYQLSCLGGSTTTPQNGNTNTQITTIVVVVNGVPKDTLLGPNFNNGVFTTLRFGGTGIPQVGQGDNVTIYVTVNSSEINNYVAWHWARNAYGFHRVPFTYVSSMPGPNGYYVTFSKNFTIWSGHPVGAFNGYINASTHESLWDDNPNLFSSTEVGIPYRVTH